MSTREDLAIQTEDLTRAFKTVVAVDSLDLAIERGENRRKDVTYHTTPRFLQLFGLGRIDELPQAEELSFK